MCVLLFIGGDYLSLLWVLWLHSDSGATRARLPRCVKAGGDDEGGEDAEFRQLHEAPSVWPGSTAGG